MGSQIYDSWPIPSPPPRPLNNATDFDYLTTLHLDKWSSDFINN